MLTKQGISRFLRFLFNTLSIVLFAMILLFLPLSYLPGVYAQSPAEGCCVDSSQEACISVASETDCTGDNTAFYNTPCSELPDCDMGCCCGVTENKAKYRFMCSDTGDTFIADPELSLNQECSCGGNTYNITGTITEKRTAGTSPASYAQVFALGVSTTANENGEYVLVGVPEGSQILVRAEKNKDGCLPNSKVIDLFSDTTLDFELNCECYEGDCNYTNNAYCKDNKWVVDDDYCASYCAQDDPDCGSLSLCVDNDRKCPLGCTPQNDKDCECSKDSNGVCPLGCTPLTDADCVEYATCGDGYVTYPYETCEATNILQPDQRSFCSDADCVDCNCISLSACGNLVLEAGEDCELGMVCGDGSPCDNCQCGDAPCEGDALNPSASATFDSKTRSVVIKWEVSSSCPPATFHVYKCEKIEGGEDCSNPEQGFSLLTPLGMLSQNWTDTNVPQTSEFCYYIKATYMIGSTPAVGESNIVCQKTGDELCLEDHPDEFCVDHVRSACDADNNIIPIYDCKQDGMVCMGPDRAGKTWCTKTRVCDLCNGLYGLFAEPSLNLKVNGSLCYYSLGAYIVQGCYLDRTKALFSAFNYCAEVTGCYDYKSKEACEEDPCSEYKRCEWADSTNTPGFKGPGGICRPKNPELQQCELCDEPEYNWISPVCNQAVCALFGECYYQGPLSPEPCTKRITATCMDYKTQEECLGGRAVSVDASYDDTGNRIKGTHSITESNDALGLGKCYWHAPNQWCMRNADNYPEDNDVSNCPNGMPCGEDCAPNDIACESDFEAPVTTIIQPYYQTTTLNGLPLYPADVKIFFTTEDNQYSKDKIKTYFCISPASNAQPCYPTQQATSSGVYETTIDTSGVYTLAYYSEDEAKNLEQVRHMNIAVDADIPLIDIIYPPNENEYTANSEVNIKAKISLDARYVCVYKEGSSTKKCLSNCVFGQTPCINSTTGEFNVTVVVPEEGAKNILFDAEDFAGNKVFGWSALSIHHNETPLPTPTIIIRSAGTSG